MIFLLVGAALVVSAPMLAAVLVTVASHREDSARSLTGRPPGRLEAAARGLLSYRITGYRHQPGRLPGPARSARYRPGKYRPVRYRPVRYRPGKYSPASYAPASFGPTEHEPAAHTLSMPRS
jgi:hypothetical protein